MEKNIFFIMERKKAFRYIHRRAYWYLCGVDGSGLGMAWG